MGTKEMMLALPEVRALTDKIPAAVLFIEPNEIQLRYFQNAATEKKTLRQQCEDIGLPWNARKIPADLVSMEAVEVARDMDPSLYAQAAPKDPEQYRAWVNMMHNSPDIKDDALTWYAFHGLELFKLTHETNYDPRTIIFEYVAHVGSLHKSTSAKRVFELGREHVELSRWQEGEYHRRMVANELAFMSRYELRGRSMWELEKPHEYPVPILLPRDVQGFEFQLLDTQSDFMEEGRAMHHCVSAYHGNRVRGLCHVASVRKDGKRIATVEYAQNWIPIQVKGPCNKPVKSIKLQDAIEAFAEFAKTQSNDPKTTKSDDDEAQTTNIETPLIWHNRTAANIAVQPPRNETFNIGLFCLLIAIAAIFSAGVGSAVS